MTRESEKTSYASEARYEYAQRRQSYAASCATSRWLKLSDWADATKEQIVARIFQNPSAILHR